MTFGRRPSGLRRFAMSVGSFSRARPRASRSALMMTTSGFRAMIVASDAANVFASSSGNAIGGRIVNRSLSRTAPSPPSMRTDWRTKFRARSKRG